MKTIITYGTFDLLHHGHIRLLKRAKRLGDYLIVGLSTDEFNKLKGKESVYSYEERKEIVEAISYVDRVIPEEKWKQKIDDIKGMNVDIFVMGSDWVEKFDYLQDYCDVIYLPRTNGISTTITKKKLYEQPRKD
jgi:glycerol-3-phosphate cytidylyltransferase